VSTSPHEELRRLIGQPDAREVVLQIRARLSALPKGRLVNTQAWDAITLDEALSAIDEVAAGMGVDLA
jgi:hypothetical protein